MNCLCHLRFINIHEYLDSIYTFLSFMMSEGDLLIPCDPFKTINIIVYRMTRIKIHLYRSLKVLVFLFYLCHVLIYFLSFYV